MKLAKKFIVMSLLGIIIVSNTNIGDVKTFANTNNNLQVEDVLKDQESTIIKKIEVDSSNNPISSKEINLNSRSTNLADGYYTLDYGDGWVKGRDAGVIGSIIVPAGTSGIFSKIHSEFFSNKITIQTSLSFTKSFVTATIKAGYGNKWTEGIESEIIKYIKAPQNKNLFAKVQSVFRRIDVIRVKNGNIVDRAETYKPVTHTFKSIEYSTGEKVDQSQLYEKETNCILGDSSYDINATIDASGKYEGYAHIKDQNEDFWSTKYYDYNDTVGVYFTVPKDGKYELKEVLYPKVMGVIPSPPRYVGVQRTLYKVDSDNDSKVSLISSTQSNIRACSQADAKKFPGDGLVADLKAGEKYLIVFNADKSLDMKELKYFSYRMRVKRI